MTNPGAQGNPWAGPSTPAQPNQAPAQNQNPALPGPVGPGLPAEGTGTSYRGPGDDARANAIWDRLRWRFFTQGGNMVAQPVTLAATTLVIVLPRREQDTHYGVSATPNWLTTVKAGSKTVTQFTLTFGTGAPANATVDVITFRSEETP